MTLGSQILGLDRIDNATLRKLAEPACSQAFLHFELYNCGPNFPTVSNSSLIPVKTVYDIKPSGSSGLIAGQVVGNDAILCGGVASTQYWVTLMKDQNTPLSKSGQDIRFVIARCLPDRRCEVGLLIRAAEKSWEIMA